MVFDDPEWEHEYPASHLGEAKFRDLSARLIFGDCSQLIQDQKYVSEQYRIQELVLTKHRPD